MSHLGLWKQIVGLDHQKTAKRVNCEYIARSNAYIIIMLNSQYSVNLTDKQILSVKDSAPAKFLEQLCILAYLINAKDLPLADKLVKPQTMPGGQFFFRGPHTFNTKKLEKAFGSHPETLLDVSKRFDAEKCDFGDTSIQLNILPRLPITIVIWKGDDQFAPRTSILFDRTAADHMPLDALLAAANLAINALANAVKAD